MASHPHLYRGSRAIWVATDQFLSRQNMGYHWLRVWPVYLQHLAFISLDALISIASRGNHAARLKDWYMDIPFLGETDV